MGIRELPSGSWQARVTIAGRTHTETFATAEQAKDWLLLTRARHIQGAIPTRLTVREYAARWIVTYDTAPVNTVTFYERGLAHIKKHLGSHQLGRVTSTDIKTMLNRLEEDHGTAEADRTYRTVSALFGAAVADELIGRSPVISKKHRPRRQRKPMLVLERPQAKAVLMLLPRWQRDTALLQLALGARFGEIAGLTPHDVTGDRVAILRRYSPHADTVRATKNHRARTLALPSSTRTTVARLIEEAQDPPPIPDLADREWDARPFDRRWLIQTATGRPPNLSAFNKALKAACRQAGAPPVTSHGLRHTYVSWMVDDGHTADQIAFWIGDTPQTVQQVYAHMLEASSAPAAASIDAVFGDIG